MTDMRTALFLLGFTLSMLALGASAAGDVLQPFPAPPAGQQRFVIHLEAKPDESLLQLELLVGQVIEVDCNRHSFMGELKRETVAGWGYTYYAMVDIRGPVSTMMACPQVSKKLGFTIVGGGPHWVRYNSKLPVVVYVPEGFEVRYRMWTADRAPRKAIAD